MKPTVAHWISVEEQLPEEGTAVLVWDGEIDIDIWYANLDAFCRDDITHWAPLPEGPK